MSPDPEPWLRAAPDGVLLRVWVGPGASRSGLAGLHGDALRVRVAAPPEGGAANRELVRLLAATFGVRERDISIEGGLQGRDKRVRIRGVAPERVRERVAPVLSVDTTRGHD